MSFELGVSASIDAGVVGGANRRLQSGERCPLRRRQRSHGLCHRPPRVVVLLEVPVLRSTAYESFRVLIRTMLGNVPRTPQDRFEQVARG